MKASEATVEQNMYGVGITIEDPDIFQFNGRWYLFAAEISNPDVRVEPERLDNKNIQMFEYTNELNSLCLHGKIVYTDWDGRVSKYFNRMDNHMTIGCKQMQKVKDGEMEHFVEMERGNASMFTHVFIVQNIGIIDRKDQEITYEIELISRNWYKICANLIYSNYDSKSDKDKNVYNIIKSLFELDELKVDSTGFTNIAQRSNIRIDYATNANESLITALPYLFDRLYLAKNQYEITLKFIAYDPLEDQYRLIDYSDETTWPTVSKPLIVLSLFDTEFEQMLFSKNSQMASVVIKKQTQTYQDMFVHKIWSHDKELNSIKSDKTSFTIDDMNVLLNSKSKNSNVNGQNVMDKYNKLNQKWFTLGHNLSERYCKDTTLWNKDFSIYRDVLDDMMSRDALILNIDGDITHQAGCALGISLDRTIEKIPEITAKQKKELYEKHRQIEGLFQIVKVRHMYKPSTPYPSYTENVVLGRNFILTPSPNFGAVEGTIFNNEFKSVFVKS